MEAAAHARDELAGEAPSLAVPLGSRSHTDKAVDVFNAVQEMVELRALIPYLPAASDDRLGYRTAHDLHLLLAALPKDARPGPSPSPLHLADSRGVHCLAYGLRSRAELRRYLSPGPSKARFR